jgi:hypothetical protein
MNSYKSGDSMKLKQLNILRISTLKNYEQKLIFKL